jgi:hypothetical protein
MAALSRRTNASAPGFIEPRTCGPNALRAKQPKLRPEDSYARKHAAEFLEIVDVA